MYHISPKTYSKPISYSNPSPYPKSTPSLIPKFDKKCLKRNRLTVYEKRTICEFQNITEKLVPILYTNEDKQFMIKEVHH